MSTVLDTGTVTARKAHGCDQCWRTIAPGERYRRTKSIGDYGFDTWRVCQQCQACVSDLWAMEVRDEDDDGNECCAYLPDVDWSDVRLWSPLWARRADLYAKRWDGQPYPTDDPTHTNPITVHGIPAEDHHAHVCPVCRRVREEKP